MFTKQQVTALIDFSDAAVERYIASHDDELKANGHKLLRGKKLKEFRGLVDVTLIDEGNKTIVLIVFNFRSVQGAGLPDDPG
ncbi:hypothetical protein [Actimicrobium sp. CCI2.3]|uniref:hypothetical protein n=1 Tax=Actimicrobium sp. CCI2.3 TaxID=3048616 RepID=UPI002AB53340|nr:hypothetical protein [Actimicrobium sp. CCI2.3]MDY7573352.1 hypothetical protein [Actimicrobium sp. CCI2.3]MEB0021750.1 hypothetical protein [Actimicrobium sp. CCI2.3]